jgi:MFS family permease
MVAEMVPQKELQPRAFSVMPLVWNLGSIFGPSFGGFFAKPAENLPGLFGDSKFLMKFPFALPNIVASAFFFIGISTGILFLKVNHQLSITNIQVILIIVGNTRNEET